MKETGFGAIPCGCLIKERYSQTPKKLIEKII